MCFCIFFFFFKLGLAVVFGESGASSCFVQKSWMFSSPFLWACAHSEAGPRVMRSHACDLYRQWNTVASSFLRAAGISVGLLLRTRLAALRIDTTQLVSVWQSWIIRFWWPLCEFRGMSLARFFRDGPLKRLLRCQTGLSVLQVTPRLTAKAVSKPKAS